MASAASGERQHLARRVFISSTAVDLRAHRERVRDTLLSLGLFPVGMEQFGAQGTGDATSVSTEKVASADAYLGIIAWRYGYVPAGAPRSVTHAEYEEAGRLGLPRYIFLADPATDAPDGPDALFPASVRDPEHRAQLDAFRAELSRSHVVDFFTTPADLAARVATALNAYLIRIKEDELTRGVRPPHDLPPRAPEFVGREQNLAALCDLLRRGKDTGVAVAVAGMPGVGKSALAAEALYSLAAEPNAFPGGITWVRCDGRSDLAGLTWIYDQLLGAWGISLSPEALARATTPAAEAELRERTLRARLRPSGDQPAPALVLLDNVERDLPIGRALDALAPLGITTLLTARHEPSSPRLRLLQLDILDQQAAVALFAERYRDRGGAWDAARDTADAVAVVEALGRLPLAIELAAVRAARARTGVAALAAELREADRLGRLRDPVDPTRSVRYAFEQSLTLLNPTRRARFATLGLPDGPDWPRWVVERVMGAATDRTDAAFPASDDLDLLSALSLAALFDHAGSSPRVRVHPLLRDLAREEWARQPEAVRTACAEALLASVEELVRGRQNDFVALSREEDLIVGTLRLAAKGAIAPQRLSATIAALETYIDIGGHWQLGLELAGLQLDACRALGDRAGEAAALNNRGYLAHRLGRLDEAVADYEQALTIRRALGDRSGEAETLNNLGSVASARGRLDEAARHYEQALAIRRAVGDRSGEATVLNNLGIVTDAAGNKDAAAGYYEQALAIQRQVGDRRGEGNTLNNLGALASARGQLEEAGRDYEQALAIQRQVGDRAGEGTTLNNLGGLSERLGRDEAAADYYEQALVIRQEVGDRRGEGSTLNNLGALANRLGRKEEAARYFEQALAAEREVGDRAGEAATFSNLGLLARDSLRPGEAARSFEQALAIEQELGNRAAQGDILNNLGLLAYAQGRRDDARRYLSQALAVMEAIGAADSARVVRDNLAALAADHPTAAVDGPSAVPAAIASAEPAAIASAEPAAPAESPSPPVPSAGDVTPLPVPSPAPARQGRRWWPWGR